MGHRTTGRPNRLGTFVDKVPESLADKEFLAGAAFIKWLTEKIASGQISMNKPPLLSVPGGMLMSVESFKWFVREHPDYKNWQAVQAGFLSLGLHKVGPDGDVISRFEQSHSHDMHSGIVLADYAVVLPKQVGVHQVRTGETVSMSATEWVHSVQLGGAEGLQALNHLSAAGEWVQAEAPQLKTKLGHHKRG